MILKIHDNGEKIVLSIIDDDLLGKKFEEGNKILDLSSDFYKGEKKSEAEIKKATRIAYIINAVGKKTIEFLKSNGLIDSDQVKEIKKIPYAYILILQE